MGALKEFYHDEICKGLNEARNPMSDTDYWYYQYLQERAKHFGITVSNFLTDADIKAINDAQAEEDRVEEQAEKAAFVDLAYKTKILPA